MPLQPGFYHIRSHVVEEKNNYLGRSEITDASRLPKAIYIFPENFQSPSHFELEHVSENTFWVKSRGDFLGDRDSKLFAVPQDGTHIEPQAWVFQNVEKYGPDAYTIAKGNSQDGWTSPPSTVKEPHQIVIRPLYETLAEGDRTTILPNEIFIFERIYL